MEKILFIGMVWPEPTSSAAGVRMMQLINACKPSLNTVFFACSAAKSEYSYDLSSVNVQEIEIQLNDSSFNRVVKDINPTVVVYDRYIIEEQYGWRIKDTCPNAVQILDTEDIHFLRYAREQAIKKGIDFNIELCYNDVAKREVASILRSDLTLVISQYEMELLQHEFHIDSNLLLYLPLWVESDKLNSIPDYDMREGFMFIGNFLHEPNWDAVLQLKKIYWPKIRQELPTANLYIYGAYPSEKVFQLNNKSEGFHVLGRAISAESVCFKHKLMLAPLRFGAGVKGKFIDAMRFGIPSITYNIGSESMINSVNEWGGSIASNLTDFISSSIELYTNKEHWNHAQLKGFKLLSTAQYKSKAEYFLEELIKLKQNLTTHRAMNFYGSMLNYHLLQSTKYMSRWIELKNNQSL